jgi:hypothetical protein
MSSTAGLTTPSQGNIEPRVLSQTDSAHDIKRRRREFVLQRRVKLVRQQDLQRIRELLQHEEDRMRTLPPRCPNERRRYHLSIKDLLPRRYQQDLRGIQNLLPGSREAALERIWATEHRELTWPGIGDPFRPDDRYPPRFPRIYSGAARMSVNSDSDSDSEDQPDDGVTGQNNDIEQPDPDS